MLYTQINQESIVPAKHLFSLIAFFTLRTLSFNHRIFNAEKYGDIVRPKRKNPILFDFKFNIPIYYMPDIDLK